MQQYDSDRSRTSSYRKHSILLQMQDNFRKVDPEFQIKYYIRENPKLVHYNRVKIAKVNNQKHEQIQKLMSTLKIPLVTRDRHSANHYFQTTKQPWNQTLTTIQKWSSLEQVHDQPKDRQSSLHMQSECHVPDSKNLHKSPLKTLFLKYKEVVHTSYKQSSPQMKKLIDSYLFQEAAPFQKSRRHSLNSESKKQRSFFSSSEANNPGLSPIERHNRTMNQLDCISQELDTFRKTLGQMSKLRDKFKQNKFRY